MLSRTAVANHAADIIINGNQIERQKLVEQLAAWLKNSGRKRQAKYLVNDIAWQLSNRGYTLITLTTARPLDPEAKQQITDYLIKIYSESKTFEFIEIIDNNVIGGVLIDSPSGILDLTVKNKLITIIKGASV